MTTETNSTGRRPGRLEPWLAALVWVWPMLYYLTERSVEPVLWRWCTTDLVLLAGTSVGFALLMLSYHRALPAFLRGLRSLAVVVGAATLAALICAEIVLRSQDDPAFEPLDNSGRHLADPDVGHVYAPNHTQRLQSREFSVEWRSNSQGLRADRDFGPKPEGLIRVLAVGDSFTVGDQVEVEDNWPSSLQRCLDATWGAGRFEVVNAGFPGFGTVNEARWIAKFGGAFEPDLVLLAMTPNDLLENQFPLQYTAKDGMMVSSSSTENKRRHWEDRARWYSLPGFVSRTRIVVAVRSSPVLRRLKRGSHVFHHQAFMTEKDSKAEWLFELMEGYLLEARDASTGIGARFAAVVIPFKQQLVGSMGPGLDAAVYGDHWVEFGAAQGFPVHNLLEDFRAREDLEVLYWKEDSHCSAQGYHLIGEKACEFLAREAAALELPEVR